MSRSNSSGSNYSFENNRDWSDSKLPKDETFQNINYQENYTEVRDEENYHLVENNYSKRRIKMIISIFILILLILLCIILFIFCLNKKDKEIKEDLKKDKWEKEYDKELGGYYYAISEKNTENSKISGEVELPDSVQTLNIRNAYIVLGIEGIKSKINIGLINHGDGWRPFYQIIPKEMNVYNEYKNQENKYVYIEIEVTNERKILVGFKFFDSNRLLLGKLNFEIDASDNLEYKDNKVEVGFFRCVSLVPLETVKDDKNDGTYIFNGKLSDLKIVKNNKTEEWGISSNNIKYSFKVYPKKVKINYKNSEETFSIFHKDE